MTKILIAEDEHDIRELITFTLTFAGYEVVATKDGQEAFEKVPEENPDLILMDVRMPRMTGFEACRALKADAATKGIPVVFLSAKGQDAEVQEGLDAGAIEYLLKPFAPNELIDRINEIVERIGKEM
jgi:DNA-binding response OmpR family regulator